MGKSCLYGQSSKAAALVNIFLGNGLSVGRLLVTNQLQMCGSFNLNVKYKLVVNRTGCTYLRLV